MFKSTLLALVALSLAACGGGSDSNDYQQAIDQASAKRSEAIALAQASPCDSAQQCASLAMVLTQGHCSAEDYRPYSLVSPTADAASAAAADERTLAERAIALAPPPVTACSMLVVLPPHVGCVAGTCQAVAPAN